MSRMQLALNVSDLDAAVDFYSALFGVEPAKLRPGYANFAVADPPLKLVLIEGDKAPGTLNHLGIEVADASAVSAATERLVGAGLPSTNHDQVSCCYAVQDKVWVHGPDGEPWETYTVLEDAEVAGCLDTSGGDGGACIPAATTTATTTSAPASESDPPVANASAPCC